MSKSVTSLDEYRSAKARKEELLRHPAIQLLRTEVASLPVDEGYRDALNRSLDRYADQLATWSQAESPGGWDALEALQQVTLADAMEAWLHRELPRAADREGDQS